MRALLTDAAIATDAIIADDRTFVVTFGRECDTIAESMAKAGLLQPPVVAEIPGRGGAYRIVCGWLRLRAALRLGMKQLPVKVAAGGASGACLIGLALCDNMGHRQFNAIEQAGAAARLKGYFPEEEILTAWLPRLGLHPSARVLDQYLRIDALETEVKLAVAAGALTVASAAELATLSPEDRLPMCRLCTALHYSASKQAEIIESCLDISQRDSVRIRDLLESEALRSILSDTAAGPGPKGEQVRAHIRRLRFPRLTQKQERFTALARRLPRAGGLRLEPPRSFEGGTYRIEILFSRPEALNEAAGALQALAADDRLKQLLTHD